MRVGKQIQLDINETDPARLRQRVARMCETLLSNTVIEDYSMKFQTKTSDSGTYPHLAQNELKRS